MRETSLLPASSAAGSIISQQGSRADRRKASAFRGYGTVTYQATAVVQADRAARGRSGEGVRLGGQRFSYHTNLQSAPGSLALRAQGAFYGKRNMRSEAARTGDGLWLVAPCCLVWLVKGQPGGEGQPIRRGVEELNTGARVQRDAWSAAVAALQLRTATCRLHGSPKSQR